MTLGRDAIRTFYANLVATGRKFDLGDQRPAIISGDVALISTRVPELTIEPLPQEYERLGKNHYRYTSRNDAFRAGIHVDTDSLVIEYEDFWRRAMKPRRSRRRLKQERPSSYVFSGRGTDLGSTGED